MGKETIMRAGFHTASNFISDVLGSQMVETHSIAFAEQIKNSKDAGASFVHLDLSEMEDDKITIEDNGLGMSPKNVTKNWFSLGGSEKFAKESMSGGKGIGRLSLFRFGKEIHVKTSDGISESEFVLNRDTDFSKIDITVNPSISRGTKIEVYKLDGDLDLSDLEIDLENLKSNEIDLEIKTTYPEYFKQTKFLKPSEVMDYIPMKAKIEIDFDNLSSETAIKYDFTAQVNGEVLYSNKTLLPKYKSKLDEIITKNYNSKGIGVVRFELNNFFLQRNTNPTIREINGLSIQNHFLKVYEGINIYRNGFKIFGHGHEDWLKLAEQRVTKSSENIDNKTTFGTIYLPSSSENVLVEKTNREGFIKGKSKKLFEGVILSTVKQFGMDRKISVSKIKKYTPPSSSPIRESGTHSSSNSSLPGPNDSKLQQPNGAVNKNTDQDKNSSSLKFLKVQEKTVEKGNKINLLSDDIVYSEFKNEIEVVSQNSALKLSQNNSTFLSEEGIFNIEYIYKKQTSILKLVVKEPEVILPKTVKYPFFGGSNLYTGTTDLTTAHPIIRELQSLNFKSKPLIHVIVLRTILEHTLDSYMEKRKISEYDAALKDKVRKVVNDMECVMKLDNKEPLHEEKEKIREKFKGRKKLRGFFIDIKQKFNQEGYDVSVHGLTHNAVKIDEERALEIANDIILPLHVLFEELKNKKVI